LLYSVGVLIAVGRAAWLLLARSSRPEGRARFAVLGVAILMVISAICRTLFAWPGLAGRLSLSQVWLGEVWLIAAMVVEILLPVSMLLLTSERLLRDLERQASHDGLTGILNRRAFLQRSEEECARAVRHGRRAAVLLLDIDHFKQINDTSGHHAGDEMLRAVVTTIKKTLRREDLFCRFGGEEFCLLLPDVDLTGASRLAERVRGLVAALRVPFEGRDLGVTVSIGVAVIDSCQPSIQAALDVADRALYSAKTKGRNRIEIGAVRTATPVPASP
jgi:diguanylate cyclase (GGDEF)-like protein